MYLKSLVKKMRNYFWASPIVWVILLVGCGAGSVLDPFVPTRIIAFGDSFMDVRTPRFTVNDATNPQQLTLIERFVANYNFASVTSVDPAASTALPSSGAFSYGQGNALVMGAVAASAQPAGASAFPVQAQINSFLNGNGSFSSSDLVVINGGTADILSNTISGTQGNVTTAASNLASLVELIISKGATHVVVFGAPNLSRTPYAYANNQYSSTLQSLSLYNNNVSCTDFQCKLTLDIQQHFGSISQNPVLVVDISAQSSVITGTTDTGTVSTFTGAVDPLYGVALLYPGDNNPSFTDTSNKNYFCDGQSGRNSVPLIGNTGTQCTSITSLDYLTYAYADQINFAPSVNRMLADYIIGRLSLASWR